MFLESGIDHGHLLLHDAFLNIDRFEETREAGTEDVVHRVKIMETNERGVYALRFVVA